jgi:hypothetical protein
VGTSEPVASRSPVFVPFDDGWSQATKHYEKLNCIDSDFLKAKLKIAESRDARDLGKFTSPSSHSAKHRPKSKINILLPVTKKYENQIPGSRPI